MLAGWARRRLQAGPKSACGLGPGGTRGLSPRGARGLGPESARSSRSAQRASASRAQPATRLGLRSLARITRTTRHQATFGSGLENSAGGARHQQGGWQRLLQGTSVPGVVVEKPFDFKHFRHKESEMSRDREVDFILRSGQLL